MNRAQCTQAWNAARDMGQFCFAIVEVGLLTERLRLQFLQSELTRRPLMVQPEFAELRHEGPWLVDVSHLTFDAFVAHAFFTGCDASTAWIRTQCRLDTFTHHLSEALLAKNDAGDVLLIRSYAPEVITLLEPRRDLPWHPWLLGPVLEWWIPTSPTDWHCLKGAGLKQPTPYQPITLDAALWKTLEVDPLPYSLTTELEKTSPQVFTSHCHSERLTQVKQALAAGREQGFNDLEDVCLFATLVLMDGNFPGNWALWVQAKKLVREQGLPLGMAMRRVSE